MVLKKKGMQITFIQKDIQNILPILVNFYASS